MQTRYDILVSGAGPAGASAALRLQQLGYRVLIAERSPAWPRPQVGEALTRGVQNIVALLDAHDALADVPHLARQPTRLLWRGPDAETLDHGGSAMVDRARFDAALLALARQRGVDLAWPAQVVTVDGQAGDWRIGLRCADGPRHVHARFLLDAGGRSGAGPRLDCAPRLAAQWIDLDQDALPAGLLGATRTEALEDGWLWGASLPGGRYRLMLVGDPGVREATPRRPAERLHASCSASRLFGALARHTGGAAASMCSATPYLALDSWREGRLKVGDAAFALDPISSSGVEKAMRFSLQAAVAIHTLLSAPGPARAALARAFIEQRLIETCVRHAHWTAASYAQSWCAGQPFWRARSAVALPEHDDPAWPGLGARLRQAQARMAQFQEPALKALADFEPGRPLRLSGAARIVEQLCVIDDQVQVQPALSHPHLERPLAFLEDEALAPHLDSLRQARTIDHVVRQFGSSMPAHKASRIAAWMWQRGLLEQVG